MRVNSSELIKHSNRDITKLFLATRMITLGYSKNLLDKQPMIKGEINQRNCRVDLFEYEPLPQGKTMPAGQNEILNMVAKTSLEERLHLPDQARDRNSHRRWPVLRVLCHK